VKGTQVATIALNQPLPVSLGDTVTFTCTGIPKKVKNPRVEVLAYQSTCPDGYTCPGSDGHFLTYGEAGAPTDSFLLGGGGSAWLAQGGSAACVANLFYFDNSGPQQTYILLATTSFPAGG
jgi:hypothetical protein